LAATEKYLGDITEKLNWHPFLFSNASVIDRGGKSFCAYTADFIDQSGNFHPLTRLEPGDVLKLITFCDYSCLLPSPEKN